MVVQTKMYMDFNKTEKQIYINYFLEEVKLSIKIPINNSNKKHTSLKIEKFKFTNYIYLAAIE